MIDPENVPPVADIELLARYVTQSGQFRSSDNTVKQDLFMPHPRQELSLTRHQDATEGEIWEVGVDVAKTIGRKLYGRADIKACHCKVDSLQVVAKPLPNNPNHADIEGWPLEKQDQKVIALKLAAFASKLIPNPEAADSNLAAVETSKSIIKPEESATVNIPTEQSDTITKKLEPRIEVQTENTSNTLQKLENTNIFNRLVSIIAAITLIIILKWLFTG